MPEIYDNVDDIFKILADIVEEATKDSFPNNSVILSHEGGPEPSASYCSVYVLGITPTTRKYVSTLADEQEYLTIDCNYEIRAQYSFKGKSGLGMGMKFFHAVNTNPIVLGMLSEKGFGVNRKSDLRSLPIRRETKFEENYSLDIHYSLALQTKQQVITVGTVRFKDPLTGAIITVTE